MALFIIYRFVRFANVAAVLFLLLIMPAVYSRRTSKVDTCGRDVSVCLRPLLSFIHCAKNLDLKGTLCDPHLKRFAFLWNSHFLGTPTGCHRNAIPDAGLLESRPPAKTDITIVQLLQIKSRNVNESSFFARDNEKWRANGGICVAWKPKRVSIKEYRLDITNYKTVFMAQSNWWWC